MKEQATPTDNMLGHDVGTLSAEHLQHLKQSGISEQIICEAELSSGPLGLEFPYHDVTGSKIGHRTRLDEPRLDQKYHQPPGSHLPCYLLKTWLPSILSVTKPLIATEGEKKLLAVCSHLDSYEYGAFSIPGCNNYLDTDRGENEQKKLSPLIKQIPLKDRKVFLIPDTDFYFLEKWQVYTAYTELIKLLCNEGAEVKLIDLRSPDDTDKVGVDDFIVKHGVRELEIRLQKPRWTFRWDYSNLSNDPHKIETIIRSLVILNDLEVAHHKKEIEAKTRYKPREMNNTLKSGKDDWKRVRSHSPANRSGRTKIVQNGQQFSELKNEIWQAVHETNQPQPKLYIGPANTVSDLTNGEDGGTIIREMKLFHVFDHLTDICDFYRKNDEGQLTAIKPDKDIVQVMLANPSKNLPRLEKITSIPIVSKRGKIIHQFGYHPDDEIYFDPHSGIKIENLPDDPSWHEIQVAKDLIQEMICEFPFKENSDVANYYALLLLPFVRRLIDGPTPLHLLGAPVKGTGKGLLLSLFLIITKGYSGEGGALPTKEEEIEKRIFSDLLRGADAVVFDNVSSVTRGPIRSESLEAALTMYPYFVGRELGHSRTPRVKNSAVWIMAGNNLEFGPDLSDRIINIRVEANVEHPRLRKGFKKQKLRQWAKANRVPLITACLTLVQAWIQAGMPTGDEVLGSFEEWASVMGGILNVIGISGFIEDRLNEKRDHLADPETEEWRKVFEAWHTKHQCGPVSAGDVVEVCEQLGLLEDSRGNGNPHSQSIKLGKILPGKLGVVFGSLKMEESSNRDKPYKLTDVGKGTPGESDRSSDSRKVPECVIDTHSIADSTGKSMGYPKEPECSGCFSDIGDSNQKNIIKIYFPHGNLPEHIPNIPTTSTPPQLISQEDYDAI